MPPKTKGNISFLLLVIVIALTAILVVLFAMDLLPFSLGVTLRSGPTPIIAQTEARRFTILSVTKDGYKVRDLDNKTEIMLFLTPKTALKAGNVIVVTKYVVAANGLVAHALDVLPAPPGSQPPRNLPPPQQ